MVSDREITRSAQAFVDGALRRFADGPDRVVTVIGRTYDEVDMGNARLWTPSHLTGNRFPSEREADQAWYGEVDRLCTEQHLWLLVDESTTEIERYDLKVRRERRSSRRGSTTPMYERFLGEAPGTARLKRNAQKVVDEGRLADRIEGFTGLTTTIPAFRKTRR